MTIKQEPKGLGGWLILPIIGLFASLLFHIADIYMNISLDKFDADILGLSSSIIMGIFLIVTLIAVFKKKQIAVKCFIGLYLLGLLIVLPGALMSDNYLDRVALIKPFLVSIIWITYFLKSRRVKNTFVN
jgi:uncharacterized membrane protein YfcA